MSGFIGCKMQRAFACPTAWAKPVARAIKVLDNDMIVFFGSSTLTSAALQKWGYVAAKAELALACAGTCCLTFCLCTG
jgi:hypothetical protein